MEKCIYKNNNNDAAGIVKNNDPAEKRSLELNLLNLPLIARYKLLCFTGLADGSEMTPQFDLSEVTRKYCILKSFRMIPYVPDPGTVIDLSLSDGVDTFAETLAANVRLDRITDLFNEGTAIRFRINGENVSIFSQNFDATNGQYIPDLWEDNIFYKFPEKVTSMDCAVFSTVTDDLTNPANSIVVNMKILIGVYLYDI